MEVGSGAASTKSVAALVLGIVSIVMAMLIALVGLVAGVIGLALAVLDRREGRRGHMTTAGLGCSAAGIVIALFNYGVTWYLIASGRYHPF